MTETSSPTAAIRTRGLTKRFGVTYALAGLDLELPTGSATALLGPREAGKTTLLNLILGKLRHTAGRIEVLGRDPLRDATPLRQRIAHVPDHPDLPRWMTLRELCDACASTHGGWDEARAAELIVDFDLPQRIRLGELDRDAAALSMLVVAASASPELLLLDQTFDALADTARDAAFAALSDALSSPTCTVLATTGDVDIASRFADRVVALDAGRAERTVVVEPTATATAPRLLRHALAGTAAV